MPALFSFTTQWSVVCSLMLADCQEFFTLGSVSRGGVGWGSLIRVSGIRVGMEKGQPVPVHVGRGHSWSLHVS